MAFWTRALDWLLPAVCPGCGRPLHGQPRFCPACEDAMPAKGDEGCACCGAPFASVAGPRHLCGRCLQDMPFFRRARACTTYEAGADGPDPLRQVLHRYKYGRDVTMAKPLAALMRERCPLETADYDVVVPMPLHIERLRWRGFNQAQLLAAEIAAAGKLAVDPWAVERVRATAPQVGQDATARRKNVRRAFRVPEPARIRGRCVLLVDDVYTSGATAGECSRAVMEAGADLVDVLVLAHAVLP